MASVSTYLNFPRATAAAFEFYRSVFKTDYAGPVMRYKDVPAQPGDACVTGRQLTDADRDLVMHVSLPILGGHVLMGADSPESMGARCTPGNNVYINLEPDTRGDTDRLFQALGAGGKVETPLQVMFWGDYFGTLTDKFGVQWMFNCRAKS